MEKFQGEKSEKNPLENPWEKSIGKIPNYTRRNHFKSLEKNPEEKSFRKIP